VKEVSMIRRVSMGALLLSGLVACSSSSSTSGTDAGPKDATGHDSTADHAADAPSTDSGVTDVDAPVDTFVPPALTVILGGDGVGTVTSTPAGINCPGTCSHTFTTGEMVTLTATTVPSSVFTEWSGACSGVTSCVVTYTGSTDVTATFSLHPVTTWDPTWSLAGVTYSNGNLSVSAPTIETYSTNIRTTVGKSSGSYYWEITATGGDITDNGGGLGILESAMPNNLDYIGEEASGLSFGYGPSNTEYYYTWAGVTVSEIPPSESTVAAGIVYMFALDMDNGNFWIGQGGTWYGGGDPSTGANPVATGINGYVYPGITLYNEDDTIDAFTANFGETALMYPVPTGFTAGFY
jgi:Divergent InlB B-repeat domain